MYNLDLNPPYKPVMTHLVKNASFFRRKRICHDRCNDISSRHSLKVKSDGIEGIHTEMGLSLYDSD